MDASSLAQLVAPAGAPGVRRGTLVIHTAFIGDLILLTPLLSRLREKFPGEPLYLVTTPVSAKLFEKDRRLDGLLAYDKRGADAGPAGFWRVLRQVRRWRPRRVLLPHRYLRTSLLGLLSGADTVSGFNVAPFSRWFQHRLAYPEELHETRRMWSLLETPPDTPVLPELDLAGIDVSRFQLPPQYLVLAPGSVWRSKRWHGFQQLADLIHGRDPDLALVLIGAAGDSRDLDAPSPAAWHDLTGVTSLLESAAVIADGTGLVCNDSAALHLGQAVGTPVVALFGSTVPAFGFGPQRDRDRVVSHSLDCKPCAGHGVDRCPREDFACIDAISAEEVLAALRDAAILSA